MEIVERFVLGKSGDSRLCEDAIVVTEGHAAVIDGATDVNGRSHHGRSGGWWAMDACRDALGRLADGVDVHTAVAALTAELAARTEPGHTAASLTVYSALVSRQGAFRNRTGPYGYAAIDGHQVPSSLVVVHPVPDGVDELRIASDGYPVIGETLAESEAALARLLERDPWCVAELAGTKAVRPGQSSFDDRAYLRIRR